MSSKRAPKLCVVGSVEEAEAGMASLASRAIECRPWYGNGIHRQPQYRDRRLAVTEDLAPRVIGLPMAPDLDNESIDRVVEALPHMQQP